MKHLIPIRLIDTGRRVATVKFKGGRKAGKGTVVAEPGERDQAKAIRDIIATRIDLGRVEFISGEGTVRGWRGFDGVLNGLLLSLGAIGMEVEVEHITWPKRVAAVGG